MEHSDNLDPALTRPVQEHVPSYRKRSQIGPEFRAGAADAGTVGERLGLALEPLDQRSGGRAIVCGNEVVDPGEVSFRRGSEIARAIAP